MHPLAIYNPRIPLRCAENAFLQGIKPINSSSSAHRTPGVVRSCRSARRRQSEIEPQPDKLDLGASTTVVQPSSPRKQENNIHQRHNSFRRVSAFIACGPRVSMDPDCPLKCTPAECACWLYTSPQSVSTSLPSFAASELACGSTDLMSFSRSTICFLSALISALMAPLSVTAVLVVSEDKVNRARHSLRERLDKLIERYDTNLPILIVTSRVFNLRIILLIWSWTIEVRSESFRVLVCDLRFEQGDQTEGEEENDGHDDFVEFDVPFGRHDPSDC